MEIITEKNFEKARNLIKNTKNEIIFMSEDDELNRKIIEKEKINILLINQKKRKDYSKQRNSGFNHVMAKIAKKKNVIIGINLDEIIESCGKEKAKIISRIKQNIKLCNKNKIQMTFIGRQKQKNDLNFLGLVLGMSTWMTKKLQIKSFN